VSAHEQVPAETVTTEAAPSQPGAGEPALTGVQQVLGLQRMAGNRAVGQVLARSDRRLLRALSWHQQRAAEIHAGLAAENWEGVDPPGAYRVFNGLSNDDQIKVYRLLGKDDRKKLEDNLDKTTGDRARMYQAIQEARAGAAGGSATGDWWRDKAEEVHWAIRCDKFVNYAVEEDERTHGRSQGAYWILSNHNDAARKRLMTFLDAESLDALLAHATEADPIPGSDDIIRYAKEARAGRPKLTRAYAVEVGEQKVGEGRISLANTGQQVTGGQVMATGPVSIAGMGLGSLALIAFKNPTLASPGTTSPPPLEVPPGVQGGSRIEQIDKTLEAIRDLQKTLEASKEAQEAAKVAEAAQRARWLRLTARGGLFVVLTLIVAGTIIVVAAAISNAREHDELPEGGVDDIPQSDAGAPDPAIAPGADTPPAAVDPNPPPPAQAPGQAPAAPASAPGAGGSPPAQAPGQSRQHLQLSGLRVDISPSRAEKLGEAEQADKWTDLEGRKRTSLGKAYNTIIQAIVREIANRGWTRTALHYVEVNRALIDRERQQGGRLLITEGRLAGIGRFDIALINFDNGTIELIDLTAMVSGSHAGKTLDYQTALEKLTGFDVASYEAHYVGEDEKLADELIIKRVGEK
jgi:hypothetical protein